MIDRHVSQHDRRTKYVELTTKANSITKAAQKNILKTRLKIFNGFSQAETEQLLNLITKLQQKNSNTLSDT